MSGNLHFQFVLIALVISHLACSDFNDKSSNRNKNASSTELKETSLPIPTSNNKGSRQSNEAAETMDEMTETAEEITELIPEDECEQNGKVTEAIDYGMRVYSCAAGANGNMILSFESTQCNPSTNDFTITKNGQGINASCKLQCRIQGTSVDVGSKVRVHQIENGLSWGYRDLICAANGSTRRVTPKCHSGFIAIVDFCYCIEPKVVSNSGKKMDRYSVAQCM
tara:strand:- start:16 stop:687 length:672 start_codon:yes stop_codon:yes gene_type:complete